MEKHTQKKEEYELLPHKEVEELKEELRRLKEFELTPTKKLEVSVLELNKKLDRLIDIFDKASHDMKLEEGGLTFIEKMKPISEKMNRILNQNAEIASGILAIADLIKEPESRVPGLMPPPGFQKPMAPPQFTPPIPPQNIPKQFPAQNKSLDLPPPIHKTQSLNEKQIPAQNTGKFPVPPPRPGINIRSPNIPQGLPPPPQKKRTFGL